MHIGLYTGAITSAAPISGGGGSQEPDSMTPIPGILDAPNVVILGASIMDGAFGSSQILRPEIAAYAQAAGFTGTVHVRSQAGDKISDTIAKHAAAAAEPAISATAGQNLYVVHTGGNNVSNNRPWPGAQSAFQSDYDALIQQISATDTVVPLPLTKRLYTSAPVVIHGDTASEENGSKPYNENIIYPAIQSAAPAWRNTPQTPFVDPYELADRYPTLLSSDGVHGYSASLSRYILARLAGRALGKAAGQSRAGSSVLYSITKGEPNEMSIGPMNVFRAYSSNLSLNHPLLCGAITQDGQLDPFIELMPTGAYQSGSLNAGTGTFSRISDPRFHIADLVNSGVYLQGTQVFTLEFAQLTPGDTVTLSAVGVRDAPGSNRRGVLTLSTGQSLELDAANTSGSNMAVFNPVTVPADGRITLSLSVAPGSTYGYLHGVMLDFG